MDEPHRNDAFDRELRQTLAAGGGAAGGPHLDAELAAAWMDRRLDASAVRSLEAHLADCADCQMMMATLARISPETPAGGEGFSLWRRLRAGWLVPATAAAAAALVIWVALPQQRAASTAPERVQTLEDRAPAVDQLAKSQPAAPVAPPPAVGREADANAEARRFAPPPSEPERKTANLEAAPPPPPATAAPAAPPATPELARRDRAAAAPPAPESLKETITVQGETPVVDAEGKDRSVFAGEAGGRASARQEAPTPSPDQLRQNAVGAAGLRAAATLTIVAADGTGRWRRAGSALEFAPRAGAGFTAVTLPVPANTISAGSSPGGTVCWLVGDGGLVLVSMDGVRFARVSAPAAVNLAAVTATDARTAIVTASNSRRFRTTDGGATWTALS